jgi:hypothetical protein
MSYAEDVRRWIDRTKVRTRDTFTDAALQVHESIVAGASLTGAPGQPVDTGNLRASWVVSFGTEPTYPPPVEGNRSGRTDATPPSPTPPQGAVGQALTASVTTNVAYAEYIEEGLKGQVSLVGGPGSVKLTRAAWGRIVDTAAKRQGAA